MNEMTFSNNSWLSCFSSECIRNSTLKIQNLFFRAKKKKNKMMIVIMMIKVVQPLSQLPNEILDKIIDFALTGTDISIIITYNSLCQLGEPFKELTMRYICRLPRISYNNHDTARNGCFSLRKLCKEFGPYSGFVMALKEIIASPRWIKAWVELLFAGVGTWFYVTNVWWKGRGSN